jgi:2-keto-4-pentenoate hydratase
VLSSSRNPARKLAIAQAADRLTIAATSGRPCAPVRDLIGSDDLLAAYAVQHTLAAQRVTAGAKVIGHKIGLTSKAIQHQLGVNQPDFGLLYDDMAYRSGQVVPFTAVLQPRVEAEIAFVLAQDLIDGPLGAERIRAAIAYAMPALEICGSRIENWDISFGDTVADNASAGAYVLGSNRKTLDEIEPKSVEMEMAVNGEVVSTGSGAACLGDPLDAVAWLALQARQLGQPLQAGQVILSGALGPMRPIAPGSKISTTITGLGDVSVSFSSGVGNAED